jgi:two-component sensor histidine kinase
MTQAKFSLPSAHSSAGEARDRLRGMLPFWADEERQTAVLLLSEVVTNALRHAPGAMDVSLTEAHGHLFAKVHDDSPSAPMSREGDEFGGRGMDILDALAHRWGVHQHFHDGKTVWFEMHNA